MCTRWMLLTLAILMIAVPLTALAGAPAVVTTARGEVQLVQDGLAGEMPSPPFLLEPGQVLKLGDGAMVVILCQGNASKFTGPDTVAPETLPAVLAQNAEGVGALNDLLTRKVNTSRAGASRAGDSVQLLRPVPGTVVLAPAHIRWSCADCGEQEVQVYDFRADEVVWSGRGTDSVAYDGPALEPGAYYLQLLKRDYLFTVPPVEERDQLTAALVPVGAAVETLKTEGVTDAAVLVSLPGTVYMQAGMPTEALYLVDEALEATPEDAGLLELKKSYEERADGARE